MVLGYGLYGANVAAAGDQQLKTRSVISETKTLSTANQEGNQFEIPNMGDLVGLKIAVTGTAAGSLVSANKINALVREISIVDVKGEPITQSIAGSDLNYLHYLTSATGVKVTETDLTSTAATDVYILQLSVESGDLPAKIKIGYNPYSAAATSGCTGGSVTVDIEAFYRDGTTTKTFRCYKQSLSMVSGTNEIGSYLNRRRVVSKVGLGFTEANLTSVLVSRDGSEEINMKTAALQVYLDTVRAAAHISGKLLVPCTPFVATDRSRLSLVTSNTGTLDLYQFLIDA